MAKVKEIVNKSNTAVDNSIELKFKVSGSAENPVIDFHQRNIDEATLEIWTAPGGTGTKLVQDTDFSLLRKNETVSAQVSKEIYNALSIINAAYHDVDLYIPINTLDGYGDVSEESDVNRLQRQLDGIPGGVRFDNPFMDQGYKGIQDYEPYKDAAQSSPEDGTGGAPILVTVDVDSSSKLIGENSLKIVKGPGNAQGEGVGYGNSNKIFSLSRARRNTVQELRFQYETPADYASDDIGVWLFDVDNSKLITPNVNLIPATNGQPGEFFCKWNATSSENYRLIFHVRTTNALAYDVLIAKIEVGPEQTIYGDSFETHDSGWNNLTDWTSVAIPVNHGLNAHMYELETIFLLSPDGTDENSIIIFAQGGTSGGAVNVGLTLFENDRNSFTFYTGATGIYFINTAHTRFLLDSESYYYRVITRKPVKNVKLATALTEYASNEDVSSTPSVTGSGQIRGRGNYGGFGAAWAVGTNWVRRITFVNAINWAEDTLTLGLVDNSTGSIWEDARDSDVLQSFIRQGSNQYGFSIIPVSGDPHSADVIFKTGGRSSSNATYAGNGSQFSDFSANWGWIVKKESGKPSVIPPLVRMKARISTTKAILSGADVVYDDVEEDTSGIYNNSNGEVELPMDGVYIIKNRLISTGVSWVVGQALEMTLYVEGALEDRDDFTGVETTTAISRTVKGDFSYRGVEGEKLTLKYFGPNFNTFADDTYNWLVIERIGS